MSIIGIDSGSSHVKIVQMDENEKIEKKLILEKMPVLQAFDVFINKEKIDKQSIQKIVLTGVGQSEISDNICNIPTQKIDEFIAIGTGGLYLTKQKKGLVVSIGTGTAFVISNGKKHKHIGGTGIGGRYITKS